MKTGLILIVILFLIPAPTNAQSDDDLCLTAAPNFTVQARIGRGAIYDLALSPDDTRLAVASGSGVWIYDADDLGSGMTLTVGSVPTTLSWSPDGSQLAVGYNDGVRIWDVTMGEVVQHYPMFLRVTHVAWSPDAGQVAVITIGRISPYLDLTVYNDVSVLTLESGRVQELAEGVIRNNDRAVWSPDGARLLFGGSYMYEPEEEITDYVPAIGSAIIWHQEGNWLQTITPTTPESYYDVYGMAWSPDGARILLAVELREYGAEREIQIRDAETQEILTRIEGVGDQPQWSADGSSLALLGQQVRLYREDGSEVVASIGESVEQFVLNRDGSRVMIYTANGQLAVYERDQTVPIALLMEHTNRVVNMAWSPDGSRLAVNPNGSSADNFPMAIYDAHGIVQTLITVERFPNEIRFSPDATRLALAHYDGLTIWELDTPERPLVNLTGEDAFKLAWSPDGRQLAAISQAGNVQVIDGYTGEVLERFASPIDNLDGTANYLDTRIHWSETAGLRWLLNDWDSIFRVYNPNMLAELGELDTVLGTSPEFLANGDIVYIPYKGDIEVYDVEEQVVSATYVDRHDDVRWSGGGGCYGYLVELGVAIVRTTDGEVLNFLELPVQAGWGYHGGVIWSPTGNRVGLMLQDGTVLVWGVE